MRAKEFIIETKTGTIPVDQHEASVGMHIYDEGSSGSDWTSDYKQYRLGIAVACTDGTSMPEVDGKSWLGKRKSTHPYTKLEADMLKKAYLAIGSHHIDVNKGDLRSLELPEVNKLSPVPKKKKNQYGV